MVCGHLFYFKCVEEVESGVADMAYMCHVAVNKATDKGAAHPAFGFILLCHLHHAFVCMMKCGYVEMLDFRNISFNPAYRLHGERLGKGFYRDTAGDLTGVMAAHAISDKKELFVRLNTETVFISLPSQTGIGPAEGGSDR